MAAPGGKNIIEEFLVSLGITADTEQAQAFSEAIEGITVRASAAIAVLKGVSLALSAFSLSAVETLSRIKQLSVETGESTQTIQAWSDAALEAGVSGDVMMNALASLNSRLGMASIGMRRSLLVFERFGIPFENANGSLMTASELLLSISNRVSQMSRQEAGAALRFLNVDPALLPILIKGRAEVERLLEIEKARVPLTEQQIEQAFKLRVSWERLKDSFDDLANVIGANLFPALEKMIESVSGFLRGNIDRILNGILRLMKAISIVWNGFVEGISPLTQALYGVFQIVLKLMGLKPADTLLGFAGQVTGATAAVLAFAFALSKIRVIGAAVLSFFSNAMLVAAAKTGGLLLILEDLILWLAGAKGTVLYQLFGPVDRITKKLESFKDPIIKGVELIWATIKDIWGQFMALLGSIWDAIPPMPKWLKEFIDYVTGKGAGEVDTKFQEMGKEWKPLAEKGLRGDLHRLAYSIGEAVQNLVPDFSKVTPPAASPSASSRPATERSQKGGIVMNNHITVNAGGDFTELPGKIAAEFEKIIVRSFPSLSVEAER